MNAWFRIIVITFIKQKQMIEDMDIRAEKLSLLEWLAGLNDPKTLKEFISLKKSREADWWDEISEEERLAINEGLAQLDRGEGIAHDQVMKEVREKYKL